MAASSPRPPLEGLRKQLEKGRANKSRLPRDGFIRETFALPRQAARDKAREWFEAFPRLHTGQKSKAGANDPMT